MQALETSTEMLSPATLRLVEDLPREVQPEARASRLEPTPRGPEPAPEGRARRRSIPEGWHIPVCVLLSVGAHVVMTVCMPSAAALQPVAAEPDLMFMDLREVVLPAAVEPPPAPEPEVVPPPLPPVAQQPLTPPPASVSPSTPPPESEPAPSAPPPAAAEVLAATSAAAGGPAFTTGTAGGSAHGVGSTPTASETNPAATRPSEGTGTGPGVDMRGLLRGYLATLSGRVRPHVDYPRAAVIAGLEGTVTIGLVIDAQGNVLRRRLKRSSGHASLDAAALEAAERVASVPAPPAEMLASWPGGGQELTVPIRMTLTR